MKEKNNIYTDAYGIYSYTLIRDKRDRYTIDTFPSASITKASPLGDTLRIPEEIEGDEVSRANITDIYPGVKELLLPYSLIGLEVRNDSFPDLTSVSFYGDPSDYDRPALSTDGHSIYDFAKMTLHYSLACDPEKTYIVPKSVISISQTAFTHASFKEVIFETPDFFFNERSFMTPFFEEHPALLTKDALIRILRDVDTLILPSRIKRILPVAFVSFSCKCLKSPFLPDPSKLKVFPKLTHFELTDEQAPLPIPLLHQKDYETLQSLTVPENHVRYDVYDGAVYDKIKQELLYFPIGSPQKTCTVREGTKSLAPRAFMYSHLERIILPDSLCHIGDYAFLCCDSLKELILPDHIPLLKDTAYYDYKDGLAPETRKLRKLHLPSDAFYIGRRCFENAPVPSVELPQGLRYLGSLAFDRTPPLAEIRLPRTLVYLGDGAIYHCPKVYAWKGTAKGLVRAINPEDEKDFWVSCPSSSFWMSSGRKRASSTFPKAWPKPIIRPCALPGTVMKSTTTPMKRSTAISTPPRTGN